MRGEREREGERHTCTPAAAAEPGRAASTCTEPSEEAHVHTQLLLPSRRTRQTSIEPSSAPAARIARVDAESVGGSKPSAVPCSRAMLLSGEPQLSIVERTRSAAAAAGAVPGLALLGLGSARSLAQPS
jgi:hypothetical protein